MGIWDRDYMRRGRRERDGEGSSPSPSSGRRRVVYVGLALLILSLGFWLWSTYKQNRPPDSSNQSSPRQTAQNRQININTASLPELDSLPGISPEVAQAIIDGRPYSQISDLKRVKGIKQARFEALRDKVTIGVTR